MTQLHAPELLSGRLMGHLGDFRHDPLGLMMRAQQQRGDLVAVRIGPTTAHFAFDAEAIKTVLVDRHQNFSKQTRGYHALRRLVGDGLVTSEGSFWRRQRRISQPAFHKQRLERLAHVMQRAASDLVRDWEAASNQTVDVATEMMRVTLRIAGETLFSYDLSDHRQARSVGGAVTDMLAYFDTMFESPLPFAHLLPLPSVLRGRRAVQQLDEVVYRIIEERRAADGDNLDLLDMFMRVRDDETGEMMSDKQLRDEVLTQLTAGHETTANALTWTLFLLSTHPDVARKVATEVDTVLAGDVPSPQELSRLEYLNRVVSESMRLYPPVWGLARSAEQDEVLGGYHIPKGAYVVISPYVTHRLRAYWDNPEGFDPDRFSPERVAARKEAGWPKHAYIPFSTGPRKCIGDHFAKMELLIILATLLRRFSPSLVSGHRVELDPSVTLRPKHGMPMILRPRTLGRLAA